MKTEMREALHSVARALKAEREASLRFAAARHDYNAAVKAAVKLFRSELGYRGERALFGEAPAPIALDINWPRVIRMLADGDQGILAVLRLDIE